MARQMTSEVCTAPARRGARRGSAEGGDDGELGEESRLERHERHQRDARRHLRAACRTNHVAAAHFEPTYDRTVPDLQSANDDIATSAPISFRVS